MKMVVTRSKTGHLPTPVRQMHGEDDDDEFDTDSDENSSLGRVSRRVKRYQDDKRTIPPYKADQQHKIHRLTKMSNVAKPRSMVGEYGTFEGPPKLMISKDSKNKVSGLTGYSELRERLLLGEVGPEERKLLKTKFSHQRRLAKVKVKDLAHDKYLQHTLRELKEQKLALKDWKTADINYREMEASGSQLVLNEMGLNLLSVDGNVEQVLRKVHTLRGERDFRTNLKDVFPRDDVVSQLQPLSESDGPRVSKLEEIGKEASLFVPIDVERMREETTLEKLAARGGSTPATHVLEEELYQGLRPEDYQGKRKFEGGIL